jgi:uncharacterized glyoxalase superfamily protein PhnB
VATIPTREREARLKELFAAAGRRRCSPSSGQRPTRVWDGLVCEAGLRELRLLIVERETNFEDVGIGGGIGGVAEGMQGHLTFYVEVPHVEAALAQAEKLGGTRLMGPSEVQPGVEFGQFSDREGHMVGLLKGPA